jgi:hypothetical protein
MPQQRISSRKSISRRSFLQQSLALPVSFLIAACAGSVSNTASTGQTVASFSPELLMQVQSTSNGQLATFDFVLAL